MSGAGSTVAERQAELIERLRPEIERSVDDLEVAVVLEAGGVDDAAAQRYGSSDVFELARALRRQVGPGARQAAPPRKDWYPSAPVAVLRGLVFTMGALAIMTAVGLGAGNDAVAFVIVVNTVGVAVMQPAAFLGYLLLERCGDRDDPSAIRPLLVLFALPPLVTLVGWPFTDFSTALFAGAALAYLVAMVLLLVLRKAVLVAAIVLPVAALAIVHSVRPATSSDAVVVGAWLAAAGVLVAACLALTARRDRPVSVRLGWVDVRAALPYTLAGLATGVVVIANLVVVSGSVPLDGAGTAQWLLVALPFLVPVSLAEVLVVGLRRGLHQATATLSRPRDFRVLGHRASMRMWSQLVGLTVVLVVVVSPLVERGDVADRVLLCASFGLVGLLLTSGLVLLAAEALERQVVVLGLTGAGLFAVWLGPTEHDSTQLLVLAVVVLGAGVVAGIVAAVRATSCYQRFR